MALQSDDYWELKARLPHLAGPGHWSYLYAPP